MAAISTNYDSYVYGADPSVYSSSSSSSSSGDFDAILAGQLSAEGQPTTTTSTSSAEQALASYDSGQQAAYALSQQSDETASTGDTTSAGDTTFASAAAATDGAASTIGTASTGDTTTASAAAASQETTSGDDAAGVGESGDVDDTEEVDEEDVLVASGASWPGDGTTMAAWTPSGMQFYDELTGQWIDDDIPHRINENGDMEYNWEGSWYLDTATRHRMMVDGEYVEVGGEGSGDGSSSQSATAQTTLDSSGPFDPQYYYNADLGQWKMFNFPTRESADGGKEYYWQDQWWTDNWNHDYAAATAEQAVASAGQTASTADQTASSTDQTPATDQQAAA